MLAALAVGCRPAPASPTTPPPPTAPPATTAPEKAKGQPPAAAPRVYIDGISLPVGLQFAPDGRLFYGEVNRGRVRIAEGGVLRPRPFASLDVAEGKEHGLLGITLAPRFEENGHVYVYYTVPKRGGRPDFNRIVRFTERNGEGTDPRVILDKIPADVKGSHNGGRMLFGPDGKLYVGTGIPGDEAGGVQRTDSLDGKILRLNPDGSIPDDNPVSGSPIFALGLRNPYGIAIDPRTGRLFAIDNGRKGNDELDLIRPGGNYGWPVVVGRAGDARFVDPLWDSGPERLGLSGLTFYTGEQLPEYRDSLLFCLWNSGTMRRVRLAGPDYGRIEQAEDIAVDCRQDVANGPDGALYVAGIDKIYRLGRL